ncbi:DinB family protein [Solitalea lacus]|uniref:DinB family protein n=1 Tax=Solitalea lacus TaxID=2911172 RepID=UPI001EDA6A93|nr:DinB family protein [Solitalea lacus]UKJ06093.1 DinB family protein [Solitalea lacus]
MKLPEQTEYNPYFQHYIDLVGEGDFETLFHQNTLLTAQYFKEVPSEKHNYRYAPNKWSVKEVLMHIIDTERVFAYRALVCARGDNSTPLHSMDEDLYAANVDVTHRTMESLIDEFLTVRKNSEFLFKNISDEQSKFLGNGVTHNISARALGFIMIGHIHHHVNVLNERYL